MIDVGGAASREGKKGACLYEGERSHIPGPLQSSKNVSIWDTRFPARWPELKACLPVAGRKCRLPYPRMGAAESY